MPNQDSRRPSWRQIQMLYRGALEPTKYRYGAPRSLYPGETKWARTINGPIPVAKRPNEIVIAMQIHGTVEYFSLGSKYE